MLDTPSLDSTIVARCQPLDDVAAMTAFAETHTAIFEEQDQDKKVIKSTAFDPFLQMSVLSEKLAGAALSFLMDFVHSVRITQRYIARAYAVTRQVYTPEEIARDDVLWAQLAGTRTRVIGIPKSIAKPVTDTISDRVDAEAEPSFELDPKSFTHVLFAFQAYNRVAYCLLPRGDWAIPAVVPRQTTAEAGATSANADAAVGGWVNTAACKGRVSRAYYKLEEVFEYLQREPAFKEAVDRAVANDTCPASTWGWWNKPQTDGTRPLTCDVGACPGGWSLSLAARGAQVLAIDPGMLSIQHPQITHVPHKLQAPECVERLNAGGPLDMVVCDVNCDIGMTTDIVLDNIVNPGLMRPGSIVVLTVKAFNKGAMNDQIKHALRLLEAKFDCLQTTWLLANRRERTIVGVRKQW
jgi:23S rRNA U2552 (ribose-2'-O)-methylase RlmE/FtsJ